jgi:hypothetical protein
MDDSSIRRRVEIDRTLWHALQPFMHEQGWTLHQAADAAFRELLRKHHRPISLHDALRESLRRQPANDQPKATVHRLRRVCFPDQR